VRSTWCYNHDVTAPISQRELRNSSSQTMPRLDEGETFIVTRAGKPVGDLSPLHQDRFVSAASVKAIFLNAPAVDGRRLRSDPDAVADQGLDPRV